MPRAEALLMAMLAVPGRSGRESAVMNLVRSELLAAGAPEEALRFDDLPTRSPHGGEVGNLVLKLPGTCAGPRRLLMAHVDTVSICEGARPVRRGRWVVPADKHTGLGADDRAGASVVLSTALEILRSKLPHPPLTFLWTVQEELGLFGARHLRVGLLGKPRLAFNFDGGRSSKLSVGATGGYRMTIQVRGRASHAGGAPEKGISAIVVASLAVAELQTEGWHGRIEKKGRQGTSNVGLIRGGDATNVVTPEVTIHAEARSHDPIFRARIVRRIEQAFRQAALEVRNDQGACGKVKFDGRLDYEAFVLQGNEPCLGAAETAIRALGMDPERSVSNGGLDANWMVVHGIPTVTLGSGQMNPHTTSERLDMHEFRRSLQIALLLATGSEHAAPARSAAVTPGNRGSVGI